MRSTLPKVLQTVGGQAMLAHVLNTARALRPQQLTVVHGYRGQMIYDAFAQTGDIQWAQQEQQLGTGHAVQQAAEYINPDERVLVLFGDTPLIRPDTLSALVTTPEPLAILTAQVEDPTGYGRILRNDAGQIVGIVEHKDASSDELTINEINSGVICADAERLLPWLTRLSNDNAQGEYYLTDLVAMAAADGVAMGSSTLQDAAEILGANDRVQLAALERVLQLRRAQELCLDGAQVMDLSRLDIRGSISIDKEVFIDVNVVFEGECALGEDVHIGPNCVVKDSKLASGTRVHANSMLDGVTTHGPCDIGPFARLRPGTELGTGCKIGNFVETKKAVLGADSKASHLSYLGDCEIGKDVNIGAGTITCNYDGVNKHQTTIGDGAFIGSDSQLVAPVSVGAGATVGAGTTLTSNAPDDQLTISRARQRTIAGWERPEKKY